MAKPALGKGLGELMRSPLVGEAPAPPCAPNEPPGPGLHSLLQGKNDAGLDERPADPAPAREPTAAPCPRGHPQAAEAAWSCTRVVLLAADALLAALALVLIHKSGGRAGGLELALGIAALVIGATLGCLACLRNPFAGAEPVEVSAPRPAPPLPAHVAGDARPARPETSSATPQLQPDYVSCK